MYQLSDFFMLLQYHLRYVWEGYPYIVLLFLLMYGLFFLSKSGFLDAVFSVFSPDFFCRQYTFCMLFLMTFLVVSVGIFCLVFSRFVFYMGNDFVYLAGILVGFRKGILVLLLGYFYMISMQHFEPGDIFWTLYMFMDSAFYFVAGLFFSTMLYAKLENFTGSEIFFICLNKIIVSMVSATCWFFLMGDSWFAGFNILLFRLVAWPMATLPLMAVFLWQLRQSVRNRPKRQCVYPT